MQVPGYCQSQKFLPGLSLLNNKCNNKGFFPYNIKDRHCIPQCLPSLNNQCFAKDGEPGFECDYQLESSHFCGVNSYLSSVILLLRFMEAVANAFLF